mgnify:CR=1 FL=1
MTENSPPNIDALVERITTADDPDVAYREALSQVEAVPDPIGRGGGSLHMAYRSWMAEAKFRLLSAFSKRKGLLP